MSNSSFSFSAAMLATAEDSDRYRRPAAADDKDNSDDGGSTWKVPREGGCRTFRPDPKLRCLAPFDPWNASPTLRLDR